MQIIPPYLHFAAVKCRGGLSTLPFMRVCGCNQRKCSGSRYKKKTRETSQQKVEWKEKPYPHTLCSSAIFLPGFFMLAGDADECCNGNRPSLAFLPAWSARKSWPHPPSVTAVTAGKLSINVLRLIGAFWVIVFQVCRNFKSHPNKETFGVFRDHGFWDSRLRHDLLDTQWLHSGDKS